ncbi:MAG TPA: hypothetical protein VGM70_11060 [Pseudolysinimonas sp.]|jgi:hypothetical protein
MRRPQPVHSLLFLPIGVVAAAIGLVPWLITGMRLPLQNLWAAATLPAAMPIVLLPFSQYSALLIVAVVIIGGTVAGIAGRAIPARHPGAALAALMGGVLLVQLIAIVQTAITVSNGLREGTDATAYLAALVGGTVAAILLGLAVLALIARAPRAGALIGLSVAAIALASWLSGLFFPINAISTASPLTNVLDEVVRYVPAVAIGAAIVWCGIQTVGRVIAVIVSLLVLLVGPTLVTAVSAALGSRVLAHYPSEMLDYAVQVFRSALGMPELWLTTLAVAIAIAAVGLVGRRTIARRSDTEHIDAPTSEPG